MSFYDKFVLRVRTNTPMQLTFLAGMILLIAMILSIALKRNPFVMAAAIIGFVLWALYFAWILYLVHCVQEGKCTVASYVLTALFMFTGIITLLGTLMPEMALPDIDSKMYTVPSPTSVKKSTTPSNKRK